MTEFNEFASLAALGPGKPPRMTCPSCHKTSSTIYTERPLKLPKWACPECGLRLYGDARDDAKMLYENNLSYLRRQFWNSTQMQLWQKFMARLGTSADNHRKAEVNTMVAIGDDAVMALIEVLEKSRYDPVARESAAEALARIGTKRAADALIRSVNGQQVSSRGHLPNVYLRVGLACLIGVISVVSLLMLYDFLDAVYAVFIFLGLISAALVDPMRKLRAKSTDALALLKRPEAAGLLAVAYHEHDASPMVQVALAEVLPLVTDPAPLTPLQRRSIEALCTSEDESLAVGAFHVIGLYGEQEELRVIEKALSKTTDPSVRNAALRAADIIRERVKLFRDKSTLLRAATSEAVEQQGLLRAAGHLIEPDDQLLRPIDPI
jgi:HEAT repeat protein